MKFCSIASGSSGNSVYISTKYTNILIDAGISCRSIQNSICEIDGDVKIDALFITHEHTDHVRGAGAMSRKFDIPIYATVGTWKAMAGKVGDIAQHNKKLIDADSNFNLNDLQIHAYSIPHDANEPVGYTVSDGKTKISIATDIGHTTETIKDNISNSDLLFLEANHDINMLQVGKYPYYLKRRILGDFGHLSNESSANLLSEIANSRLKYVFLAHMSKENNMPEIAFETFSYILNSKNIDLEINIAPRCKCSRVVEL